MAQSEADTYSEYVRKKREMEKESIEELIEWCEDFFAQPEGIWAQAPLKVLRRDYNLIKGE